MKPYYSQGGITIYHGDCRDVLPRMARKCVDLTLADPPYNVGIDYGIHNDRMPSNEYKAWLGQWFVELRRICARTIVFPGHGNLNAWFEFNRPSAIGCWYKPGNGRSSIIGWEEWEPWLYWTGDKGMLGGSSVIRAPAETENIGHPCPKPLALCEQLLRKCKSSAVLDPFVGSGTTLRAAKNLGIAAIGIEVEERYCEIAVKRLGQEVFDLEAA